MARWSPSRLSWIFGAVGLVLSGALAPHAVGTTGVAERLFEDLNGERQRRGAGPLARSDLLDRVARARALETAALPEGTRFQAKRPIEELIHHEGMKRFRSAVQYLAYQSGYEDQASAAVRNWREYTPAWEQAMESKWTDVGIALAESSDGTLVVTAVFVERAGPRPDLAALERAVFDAVNLEREREGLRALARDTALDEVARAHSLDMARRGFMAHVTPEGTTLAQRIASARIEFTRLGENLARSEGRDDPVLETVAGWMDSRGHRANILEPTFVSTGVGLAEGADRGEILFTQIFLTPLRPVPAEEPSTP